MKNLKLTLIMLAITIGANAQNECLDFDGIDDYLLMGDVNNLGSRHFTIEAWVDCESTAGIGQFVICKGGTSSGTLPNAGYGLRINDTNMNDIDF